MGMPGIKVSDKRKYALNIVNNVIGGFHEFASFPENP